jgi:hypothetical protein
VILGAGRAAAEVGGQRGHDLLGVAGEHLAVDVGVESREARVAGDFGLGGTEEAVDGLVVVRIGHGARDCRSWPAAASCAHGAEQQAEVAQRVDVAGQDVVDPWAMYCVQSTVMLENFLVGDP